MATTKKKTSKTKKKSGLISKLKSLVPRKKASTGRALKNALKDKTDTRMEMAKPTDPAHSPGHRRMNLKGTKGPKKTATENESAVNNMARDNKIARTKSNQRKIITGAALGKTGRMA